jgi:Mg-chelatase subunit ChlD
MDISSFYTQIQDDAATSRSGGLILKGRTRNTRQPIHMILAVDTSGSMELEDKLPSVKKSIQLMLSFLSSDDRLSLVTFSDDSKTFLNRVTPTPEERQAIQYRISNLTADGSTNMSAGLLEARGLVEPPSSGRKQGLILLTDGHANIGVHSEEGLLEILKRIQTESSGLSLTTVAYGVDHNSEMLTNLAKAGGGAYNVVSNLEDVATVFGDILGGLISVSAQKVELQLPPGATALTSYRTETDPAGMTTVYVGDLYADAEITILFKASPSQGPIRIKGTDMTTLDPIDVISDPLLLTDINAIPISLIMAEYRQKTIDVLTTLRKTKGSIVSFQPQVEALIKQIQDDDRIRDHPLKAMLLEDLEQANTLARRGYLTQNEHVELAQHTTYLGISKGLRSITTHAPHVPAPRRARGGLQRQMAVNSLQYPDAIGSAAPPSPPRSPPAVPVPGSMTSPFANRMQTQIASVMRTMSQQPQEE